MISHHFVHINNEYIWILNSSSFSIFLRPALSLTLFSWQLIFSPGLVFRLHALYLTWKLSLISVYFPKQNCDQLKKKSSPILNELTSNSQEIWPRVVRMPIMPGDQVCHNIDSLWPRLPAAHFSPPNAPTDRVSPWQLPRRVLPGLAAPLPGARVSLPGLRIPLIPLPEEILYR